MSKYLNSVSLVILYKYYKSETVSIGKQGFIKSSPTVQPQPGFDSTSPSLPTALPPPSPILTSLGNFGMSQQLMGSYTCETNPLVYRHYFYFCLSVSNSFFLIIVIKTIKQTTYLALNNSFST